MIVDLDHDRVVMSAESKQPVQLPERTIVKHIVSRGLQVPGRNGSKHSTQDSPPFW